MNDFCLECVGGHKNIKDIYECDDRKCPFYRDRRANLDWQDKRKKWKEYYGKLKSNTKKSKKELSKAMDNALKNVVFKLPEELK